jgi:hypothetical protein
MTQPFINFGELELDGDDRPTWPPPGSSNLVIEDKYEPLFTSATWTIMAYVDEDVISKSTQSDKAHSSAFIRRWSRQMIRSKYELLRMLGVDVDEEYVKLGGDLVDLRQP